MGFFAFGFCLFQGLIRTEELCSTQDFTTSLPRVSEVLNIPIFKGELTDFVVKI